MEIEEGVKADVDLNEEKFVEDYEEGMRDAYETD